MHSWQLHFGPRETGDPAPTEEQSSWSSSTAVLRGRAGAGTRELFPLSYLLFRVPSFGLPILWPGPSSLLCWHPPGGHLQGILIVSQFQGNRGSEPEHIAGYYELVPGDTLRKCLIPSIPAILWMPRRCSVLRSSYASFFSLLVDPAAWHVSGRRQGALPRRSSQGSGDLNPCS